MNTRTLLSFGLCMLAVTGLACRARIKTSTYIVHRNFRTELGVSSGGTLNWVPQDGKVGPFKVHFFSESPCQAHQNDLLGSARKPASCKIRKNSDGVFSYAIGNPDTKFDFPEKDLKSANPPVLIIYAHVDGCPWFCPQLATSGPSSLNNPDIVHIQCQGGTTSTDPATLAVYRGQIIEWAGVGMNDVTWEASGLGAVCSGGSVFGTSALGKDVTTCTVKDDAPQGQPITYQVKLSSCNAGSSTLTVNSQ